MRFGDALPARRTVSPLSPFPEVFRREIPSSGLGSVGFRKTIYTAKLGVMACACYPSTLEVERGSSGIQGHLRARLHDTSQKAKVNATAVL